MSELNRMLSDLSAPAQKENTVSLAAIPSTWGFRVVRVVLAIVATLVGASGIAWAIAANGDNADREGKTVIAQPQAIAPALIKETDAGVAIHEPVVVPSIITPSVTTKVATQDITFVALNDKPKASAVAVKQPDIVRQTAFVSEPKAAPMKHVEAPLELAAISSNTRSNSKADTDVKTPVSTSSAAPKNTPRVIAMTTLEPSANSASTSEESAVMEDTSTPSLTVETVELSGEDLAAIAYKKAQKRTQVGDTQKAIVYLRDAVKYQPTHLGATNQLAGLLYGRGKLRDAESVLRKGISANPQAASLKLTLARMYQQSSREESALNVLMTPVDTLDGEQRRFMSMRAALAQKLGRHGLAKDSYQWLTRNEPHDGRWWLGYAVSSEREGDLSTAKESYQSAIQAGGLSDKSVQFARQRLVYINNQAQKEGDSDGR
ncbi:tetratricopeptide repeat protein [Enterovibrio norvegicus]|uniref:tetratricopeptide repeat protein n=1 Tax=Enterovibrio norvegicus TaxID=188144 RepID=UPI0024B10911|nr:tetratricopeptide repeat protein [Enterovibrio norvegicus]